MSMRDVRLVCVCGEKGTCFTCKTKPSPAMQKWIREFTDAWQKAEAQRLDEMILGKEQKP